MGFCTDCQFAETLHVVGFVGGLGLLDRLFNGKPTAAPTVVSAKRNPLVGQPGACKTNTERHATAQLQQLWAIPHLEHRRARSSVTLQTATRERAINPPTTPPKPRNVIAGHALPVEQNARRPARQARVAAAGPGLGLLGVEAHHRENPFFSCFLCW